MILYLHACLNAYPHLHRYLNIFQTITHIPQCLILISNLLRSWDLCPQQRPQSWPCLQWWGSQAVTLWCRHKNGLKCNLPINPRILSSVENFLSTFFRTWLPSWYGGLYWDSYTCTGAEGLHWGGTCACQCLPTHGMFIVALWTSQVVWLVLIAFFLAEGFHKPVSQEIPTDLRAFCKFCQPAFCIILQQTLLQMPWAESTPRTGLGDRIALNVIRIVGGTTNCT